MSWASFAKGVGGSVGGSIADRVFDKILPISTPSGKELGKTALDYYNTAYPGTNAWERLGAPSPAAAQVGAAASERNTRAQISAQRALGYAQQDTMRDLKNKDVEIARINFGAQTGTDPDTGEPVESDVRRFGALTSAGATVEGAGIGADASRDVARINERASNFAALVGNRTAVTVEESRKDSAMWSAVISTGDPALIKAYFKESGRNPATIAGTLKSAEVNKKIDLMNEQQIQTFIDNVIRGQVIPFAKQMAEAGLTYEQTKTMWTWLENASFKNAFGKGDKHDGNWSAAYGIVAGALTGVGRGLMQVIRGVFGSKTVTRSGNIRHNVWKHKTGTWNTTRTQPDWKSISRFFKSGG